MTRAIFPAVATRPTAQPHQRLSDVPQSARLCGCPCAVAPHQFAHLIRPTRPRTRTPPHNHVCARPSSSPPRPATFFQIFFFRPRKHLRTLCKYQQPPLCARNTTFACKYGGQSHVPAPHRLRPRHDQTHPSRQRRHASCLLRARPALLPGPLVVAPTAHRGSTRRSPRESPRSTIAPARSATRASSRDFRVRAANFTTGSLHPIRPCIFNRSCCDCYRQWPTAGCWPGSCCHQSTHQ